MPQGAFRHISSFGRRLHQPWMSAILNRTRTVARLQPFTLRGALGLVLSVIIFFQIAIPLNDLIASMLGSGLFLLLALALLGSTIGTLRLQRRLQITHRMESLNLVSHSALAAVLHLQGVDLFPFTQLRIKRRFEYDSDSVRSAEHVISGVHSAHEHTIRDTLVFPHRGVWNLTAFEIAFGDAFGLTEIGWLVHVHDSISVDAPAISIRPLPIVASSSRSGDEISLTRERTGDPFDLKAYDPSDGINRILWKTFAKTGELVVRRPEPAVVPEGEIAIFVVASKLEDEVAGAFHDYYRQLVSQNITALVSVDGSQSSVLESDERKILDELNAAVWDERAGRGDDFPRFVSEVRRRNPYLMHVVVFCSSERYRPLASRIHGLSLTAALALVPPHFRRFFTGPGGEQRPPTRPVGLGDHPGISLHLCECGEPIDSRSSRELEMSS